MIWVGGFIYSNDLTLKISSINRIKANKVLVIFPHADDEALSTGGFMSALSSRGTDLRWVIITKGEKGTPDGRIDESLKTIRINESKKAAKVFKVSNLTQGDFPDGGLNSADKKLNEYITKIIDDFNPDLVITYDLSGLYGHPDHIAVSEIVTKVVKNKSKMKLWYVSFPKRILATISLPTHMAKDKNFMKKRMIPTHKIWVGAAGVWNKIQVSYVYQSQGGSSSRNMPIKFIPFWFYISLTPFEYFYEVKR
jgi:LmbE family N-acetylglucosaminyl deacetylase